MRFAFRKLLIATLGLAALASAQPVSAGYQTITETVSFGSAGSPLITPNSASLSFLQFDTTLGTLTGVTIALTDNVTVASTAINYGGSTASYTNFVNNGILTVLGPDNTSTFTSLTTIPGSGTVAAMSMVNVNTNTANNLTSGPVSVASANFGLYEGVGSGTFNVSATPSNNVSGTFVGTLAPSGYVSVYGSVTITYSYTPTAVPEPASMAMVAMGLGAVVVACRYRRRAA